MPHHLLLHAENKQMKDINLNDFKLQADLLDRYDRVVFVDGGQSKVLKSRKKRIYQVQKRYPANHVQINEGVKRQLVKDLVEDIPIEDLERIFSIEVLDIHKLRREGVLLNTPDDMDGAILHDLHRNNESMVRVVLRI